MNSSLDLDTILKSKNKKMFLYQRNLKNSTKKLVTLKNNKTDLFIILANSLSFQ